MTIELLITQINEQSDDAKNTLESILIEKITSKLEEKKREIMAKTFSTADADEEDEDEEDGICNDSNDSVVSIKD